MMATERIESGRLQLQAPGTVPMQQITPRDTDFVGYQAQAQSASTLSQLIDRMSQTAFQFAGEAAKERALVDVANQRLTPQQLELAARGDMSMLAGGSPFNIYDATVRKARSMELAGHFDTEAKGEVVRLMTEIDAGRITSEQAAQKLNTMTTGFSRALAKVDADAAIKFTAQTGIYGHTLMAEAYKRERDEQRKRTSAQLAIDYQNTLVLVQRELQQGFKVDADGVEVPGSVVAQRMANDFLAKAYQSGEGAAYAPKVAEMLREAKVATVSTALMDERFFENPIATIKMLRTGRLNLGSHTHLLYELRTQDPASLIKVELAFDAAVKRREGAESLERDREQRRGLMLEADFADALATTNVAGMEQVLREMRSINPVKYASLRDDLEKARNGTLFATTDNQMVVEDLDRRFANVYGENLTFDQVFQQRSRLTESTYRRYIDKVKGFGDERTRIMRDLTAQRLRMSPGPVLNRDMARMKQEATFNGILERFAQARRADPNLDPLTWLDANFDAVNKVETRAINADLVNRVLGRSLKTINDFDTEIGKAQRLGDTSRANELRRQRKELQDAIKAGLVDSNGQRVGSQ
jgi:hypothetical protein